jgi:uncharacterized sulfatase
VQRKSLIAAALMVSISFFVPLAAFAQPARPNILFIMTDDQGPWAWGGGGHPNARTPHLDRLRAEGVHLANYLVTTPVCSPARASMLTSRYGTEVGITDFLPEGDEAVKGLDPALPAWPRALRDAGYRTAHIGKWHVGARDESHPRAFGYDYFAGWRHGAMVSKDPEVEFEDGTRVVPGYTSDIITDVALDYIAKEDARPFLLSLHYWAPHANANKNAEGDRTWMPLHDEDWNLFKDLKPTLPEPRHPDLDVARAERMTREYLASVHSVDRNLGRILAALDAQGLRENTLVIFTSDHGYNLAHHGIWHKGNGWWLLKDDRSTRTNLWDTSVRAPAILRWPAGITAGTTVTRTTSNLDWFPSLLALAGVPLPEGALVRGQNFAPLLRGESPPWNDDFLIQYDQRENSEGAGNLRAFRTPEWKLIRDFRHTGRDELYHLATDPDELDNLIQSEDPAIQSQLTALEESLRTSMKAIGDPAAELPLK